MQRDWVVSKEYRAAVEAMRQRRLDLGLSQREVSRRLDKPPSFLNKIELLERRIDVLEFLHLARALGDEPKELLAKVVAAVERAAAR